METSLDGFLGGRLRLRQPRGGYRAGIEPVLLAAACDVAPGARVLELGCGVGTALFCLAMRVPGLELAGVERNAALAELARQNARDNGIAARIVTADLRRLPAELRAGQVDLVLANPPFFDRDASTRSAEPGREGGRGEDAALADWIDVATRRLAPRGRLVVIQRIERLPDLIRACDGRLGGLEVIPLQPREERPPRLFLMRARKSGRAAFCLKPPVILHAGAAHLADGEDYRPEIAAILRDGAPLPTR